MFTQLEMFQFHHLRQYKLTALGTNKLVNVIYILVVQIYLFISYEPAWPT